jgi:uncharacterized membrane protein
MFDKIARSWALSKASWSVLRSDKQLVLFPLLSSVSCLLVLASFAAPVAALVDWSAVKAALESKNNNNQQQVQLVTTPVYYVILFAFYFVNFTVIAFFNAALIACAMRKFEGEEATMSTGLRVAASRFPQILGWAALNSTIGVILRMIADNSGIVGRIVIGLIGFVWTIATYFVVPVLVVEKIGPIDAIKRSGAIIKKNWGESLVVNAGLGALSFVGFLLALIPLAIGIALTVQTGSAAPVIIGVAAMVLMLIALALITSTLQVILIAALYRFAATGLVPEHFDGGLLRQVFRDKKAGKR